MTTTPLNPLVGDNSPTRPTDIHRTLASAAHQTMPKALRPSLYVPVPPTDTGGFHLSDVEFREVLQATIVACYDITHDLGVAADHWASATLGDGVVGCLVLTVSAVLGATFTVAHRLLSDVRHIGRRVHEEETGLPASW